MSPATQVLSRFAAMSGQDAAIASSHHTVRLSASTHQRALQRLRLLGNEMEQAFILAQLFLVVTGHMLIAGLCRRSQCAKE